MLYTAYFPFIINFCVPPREALLVGVTAAFKAAKLALRQWLGRDALYKGTSPRSEDGLRRGTRSQDGLGDTGQNVSPLTAASWSL